MKNVMRVMTAIVIMLIVSACNWKGAGRGILLLNGVDLSGGHEHNGCDEWYDFADPGCY